MINHLQSLLEQNPIITAVKDEAGLVQSLACPQKIVFVLFGSVITIPDIVEQLKSADKTVFVDIDLLDGLSAREAAVDYIAQSTQADGIVSTKPSLVRRAHTLGLATVYRTFLLDNMALQGLYKTSTQCEADFLEILPGICPKMIDRLSRELSRPLIASGLLSDKDDVIAALSAGAIAVSSTCPDVWAL